MSNLKKLLTQPLRKVPNSAVVFMLVIALIGFADAAYLSIEHFRGVIPPCSLTADCDLVLTSQYSVLFGVPVSLLGAIYYLIISIGLFAYLESKSFAFLKWTLLLTIVGLLTSFCLIYIQVFVLHSYCTYCMLSALTSTILFISAMEILDRYKGDNIK